MTSRLPFWRERYERTPQTDHKARLGVCLAAAKRATDEYELNLAFWWLNTAAMHVQRLQEQQNTVLGGKSGRRRP